MHNTIKRVLFFMAVMGVAMIIAILFTETRESFIAVFGLGLVAGIAGELLFWGHILLLPGKRRGRR
ncbi:MAG: hypothetical protein PVH89_02265 [Gammaproteobacteria bacterium]|jgi:hypothetical protein